MKPITGIIGYVQRPELLETVIDGGDFAEDMPAIITTAGIGGPICILTRWLLSDQDLVMVMRNKSIWVELVTDGNPIQPMRLSSTPPQNLPVVIVRVEKGDGEHVNEIRHAYPDQLILENASCSNCGSKLTNDSLSEWFFDNGWCHKCDEVQPDAGYYLGIKNEQQSI